MTSSPATPSAPSGAASYDLTLPSGPVGPMVFASPHSGTRHPADFRPAKGLSQTSLRSAQDAFVDRLIDSAPAAGVAVISGQVSRAYVDLNRAPEELDPELISGVPTAGLTAKTLAGFGVLPRRAGDGTALYDRRLTAEEARVRLAAVHAPYHAALADRMEAARQAHGYALLIDWHSMPSPARPKGSGPVSGAADVILGDRHGSSCPASVTRRLRALFEAEGWRVGLNHPYAGGYSTQIWGRPAEGYQSIQIELARALYLDETTYEPGAGFSRCRRIVARVIAAMAGS